MQVSGEADDVEVAGAEEEEVDAEGCSCCGGRRGDEWQAGGGGCCGAGSEFDSFYRLVELTLETAMSMFSSFYPYN